MRLILDTHVLLWWWADSPELSTAARELILDAEHDVSVSSVSVAEIAVKRSTGRLVIDADFADDVGADGFSELPLTGRHARRLAGLPLHHRDPFDRMLVAQAQVEGAALVTVDRQVKQYDVATLP